MERARHTLLANLLYPLYIIHMVLCRTSSDYCTCGRSVTRKEANCEVCTYILQGQMNRNQPLARLALGERLAATLGALDLALPPPFFFPAALPPKNAQKPHTPTRGEGGSSAGETRPAPALYPPCPLERLRCTTRGAGGGPWSPAPRRQGSGPDPERDNLLWSSVAVRLRLRPSTQLAAPSVSVRPKRRNGTYKSEFSTPICCGGWVRARGDPINSNKKARLRRAFHSHGCRSVCACQSRRASTLRVHLQACVAMARPGLRRMQFCWRPRLRCK
jgi:hypothetical protein